MHGSTRRREETGTSRASTSRTEPGASRRPDRLTPELGDARSRARKEERAAAAGDDRRRARVAWKAVATPRLLLFLRGKSETRARHASLCHAEADATVSPVLLRMASRERSNVGRSGSHDQAPWKRFGSDRPTTMSPASENPKRRRLKQALGCPSDASGQRVVSGTNGRRPPNPGRRGRFIHIRGLAQCDASGEGVAQRLHVASSDVEVAAQGD